ncbi:uncharacterized protein [Linepithema humile]|uniref:uncharacterized protein n=1 Tax=Linepithema humile TaxID=83485 RepID=UPI00351E2C1C
MNEDTFCDFKMSYLEAIQKIPGDTASEKFRWIGKLASDEPNAIENHEKVSPELLPLLRVEVAVKHKRHEDITLALISNVSTIVSRALKAAWFFDGRHGIVDVTYFCKRIFPSVSLHTRNRIVKTLSRRIQNPIFAQEMFMAVASTYNIETALPLITICDKTFICETLTQMNRLPSVKILKKLFFKNRNLGQYLLTYFAHYYFLIRNETQFRELFKKYKYLLPKVVKKDPTFLVDIINIFLLNQSQLLVLSNTCAKIFLRKALQCVIENPRSYHNILPKRIFNAVLAKKFPDLINSPMLHKFYSKEILHVLTHHPEDKNFELCLETYRKVCNGEPVNIEDVTPFVLRALPAKKRMQLAREKINSNSPREAINCSTAWICYFPAKRATSVIKLKLNQTSDFDDKFLCILEMIYACEVNNDDYELYNTLKYIIDKRYLISDNAAIDEQRLNIITFVSKPMYLSERSGFLVYDMIQMFYEKYGYVHPNILYTMMLHRLIHHNSIEHLIEMLLKSNDKYTINVVSYAPVEYLQYYKQFIVSFINIIQKKYAISWGIKLQQEVVTEERRKRQRQKFERRRNHSRMEQGDTREDKQHRLLASINEEKSRSSKIYLLCCLMIGMYNLRETKIEKTRKRRKIYDPELVSITKYPWFMNAIYTIMRLKINFPSQRVARILLHKFEPELYRSWFLPSTSKNIENVTSGAALRLLKQNSQSVLDNWEEYLIDCKRHYRHKHVQRFVRATRWYKDIPVKFAERCISDLYGENMKEISSALIILSLLLDGNSLAKLINPLILARLETAMDKHKFVRALHFITKFSDSPESL